MTISQDETYITRCGICKEAITIIARRPPVCKNCKTNLAYLARNIQCSDLKINNLKLRLISLSILKNSPSMSLSKVLRQAIKVVSTNKTAASLINQANLNQQGS